MKIEIIGTTFPPPNYATALESSHYYTIVEHNISNLRSIDLKDSKYRIETVLPKLIKKQKKKNIIIEKNISVKPIYYFMACAQNLKSKKGLKNCTLAIKNLNNKW